MTTAVAWQYRVMYDKGSSRENEWCDWHNTDEAYYNKLCAEIITGQRVRVEVRALYTLSAVMGERSDELL
jgi:hypothetical protein